MAETHITEHDGVRVKVTVPGVGPDAPIVENERGGKQSKVAYRYDLIPAEVLERIARIFDYGAKIYEPDNWKKISLEDHINHCLVHIMAYRLGDSSDDHLGHATWRMIAAYWTAMQNGYDARQPDEKEVQQTNTSQQENIEIVEESQPIDTQQEKMCIECHEKPVRNPMAGYCDDCYDKWYGQKARGSE